MSLEVAIRNMDNIQVRDRPDKMGRANRYTLVSPLRIAFGVSFGYFREYYLR